MRYRSAAVVFYHYLSDEMSIRFPYPNARLITAACLLLIACGQRKPTGAPGKTAQASPSASIPCIVEKSGKSPRETYPFRMADQVHLLSYAEERDVENEPSLIINGALKAPEIKDDITLTREQTDALFAILYDYRAQSTMPENACFKPGHAIIFYRQQQPLAYIEVSFPCGTVRHSRHIDIGSFCDEKFCRLQDFFKQCGIRRGVKAQRCK
ncbi:hypothetical protein ACWKWU_22605 [Chitinophaga lutea]